MALEKTMQIAATTPRAFNESRRTVTRSSCIAPTTIISTTPTGKP